MSSLLWTYFLVCTMRELKAILALISCITRQSMHKEVN